MLNPFVRMEKGSSIAILQKKKNSPEILPSKPLGNWWPLCESNTVPTDYESAALTKHELRGRDILV